ncbi:hypothetical protein [Komagataeibacter saccharivorans]|nr:hypothetical protein [Komagataeibacter saccharivorans]GBQ37880.1 hypothetical protein AA0614_1176 [Komagataeibacter saccharivorans NRIC 0614]
MSMAGAVIVTAVPCGMASCMDYRRLRGPDGRAGRSGGSVMQQNGTDLIMADAVRKGAGDAFFHGKGMGTA